MQRFRGKKTAEKNADRYPARKRSMTFAEFSHFMSSFTIGVFAGIIRSISSALDLSAALILKALEHTGKKLLAVYRWVEKLDEPRREKARKERAALVRQAQSGGGRDRHRYRQLLLGYCVRKLCSNLQKVIPFAAICLAILTIAVVKNQVYALSVEYNGEFVGYISDETVFDKAEDNVRARIVFEEYIAPEETVPVFSVAMVQKDDLLDSEELTDKLIQASGNEIEQATGLYVDGEFCGAVSDGNALVRLLDGILDEYRTGTSGERVTFNKTVEVKDGLFPKSSVVSIALVEKMLETEKEEERTYVTVAGDTPSGIAVKMDMPYSQLKQLNPDIEKKLLIGQEVLIAKAVPFLGVKVIRTETYEENIMYGTEQIVDNNYNTGYTKIISPGEYGINQITAEVTYVDGVVEETKVLSTTKIKDPVNQQLLVGGSRPLQQIPQSSTEGTFNFIWPTDAGHVSCGWWGYYGHNAIDIAAPAGTGIRASAGGTVITAGWKGSYGYCVMIDHGNGYVTLYAHNSTLYVRVGEKVEQGQLIAGMGRTGNATGNHCHFEIRLNGQFMNPEKYLY